jgi:hypothetical protein
VDLKTVAATPLLIEAADILGPVKDDVVVVGATAIEVALGDTTDAVITPTRDIDVVVPVERVKDVVAYLEKAKMEPSPEPHERPFTWVRGDLKVQLVRSFHPFPKPPAQGLPENPVFGMAARPLHQTAVAFSDAPDTLRLRCANAACLLALKQAAFGRTGPPDGAVVERDYHDAYLLISAAAEIVVQEFKVAEHEVRKRGLEAVSSLAGGGEGTQAAARQMVRLLTASTQRAAEAEVQRAARLIRSRLG